MRYIPCFFLESVTSWVFVCVQCMSSFLSSVTAPNQSQVLHALPNPRISNSENIFCIPKLLSIYLFVCLFNLTVSNTQFMASFS